jgi:hypothetical protein
VDARDARAGLWEAVASALPQAPGTLELRIDHAPALLVLTGARADSLALELRAAVDSQVTGRLQLGLIGAERSVGVAAAGADEVRVPLSLPAWVGRVVVDLVLDPAQWPRFTDFGLSAVDASGRILGKSPANYARSRLSFDLPEEERSDLEAGIVLAPGFAEPGSRERWRGRVTVRYYARRPQVLETREGEEFRLDPRRAATFTTLFGTPPWSLPPGSLPLLVGLLEAGGSEWTWELPARLPR